jgi:hypothetical protein
MDDTSLTLILFDGLIIVFHRWILVFDGLIVLFDGLIASIESWIGENDFSWRDYLTPTSETAYHNE